MTTTSPTDTICLPESQQLSLRRSDSPGVSLPLKADKTTIGSGQSCSLRLTDHGVRPLHCLITLGSHGPMIRRWSDETLLNGELFTEAPLHAGDRLSIGPVELELLSEEQLGELAAPENPPTSLESIEEPTVADSPDEENWSEAPESDFAVEAIGLQRGRTRKLIAELRTARVRVADLQSSVDRLKNQLSETELERDDLREQRDQLVDQLESTTEELAGTRDQLSSITNTHSIGEQEFNERLSELEQQLTERNELVLELRGELVKLSEELASVTSSETSTSTEPTAAAEPTVGMDQELDASVDPQTDCVEQPIAPDVECFNEAGVETPEQADSNQQSPPRSENLWDVERQEANAAATCDAEESIFDPFAEISGAKDAELETEELNQEEDVWGRIHSLRETASEQLHSQLESATTDPATSTLDLKEEIGTPEPLVEESREPVPTTLFDPPVASEDSKDEPHEPESFVERYKHLLDEEGDADIQDTNNTSKAEPVTVAQPVPDPTVDDGDESIEDYMAKMMARLRGDVTPAVATESSPGQASREPGRDLKDPKANTEESESCTEAQETVAAPQPAKQPPIESLSEITPASKPDSASDLTTLRDLANSSAREAIKLANSKRARERAASNLLLCGIAAGAGGYLVWVARGQFGMSLIGGAVAVAAAGYWALRTLGVFGSGEEAPSTVVEEKVENMEPEVACHIAGVEPQQAD